MVCRCPSRWQIAMIWSLVVTSTPPDLLAAINTFHHEMEVITRMAQEARLNVVTPADLHLHEARCRSLTEVRDLADAYAQSAPPRPPELIMDVNSAASDYHAVRLQALHPERSGDGA